MPSPLSLGTICRWIGGGPSEDWILWTGKLSFRTRSFLILFIKDKTFLNILSVLLIFIYIGLTSVGIKDSTSLAARRNQKLQRQGLKEDSQIYAVLQYTSTQRTSIKLLQWTDSEPKMSGKQDSQMFTVLH